MMNGISLNHFTFGSRINSGNTFFTCIKIFFIVVTLFRFNEIILSCVRFFEVVSTKKTEALER